MKNDKLILGGHEFNSRFILGSGKYSLDVIKAAVENAGAEIITLALRRAVTGKVANILDYIPKNVTLAQYLGCKKCRLGCKNCKTCKRGRLRRLY